MLIMLGDIKDIPDPSPQWHNLNSKCVVEYSEGFERAKEDIRRETIQVSPSDIEEWYKDWMCIKKIISRCTYADAPTWEDYFENKFSELLDTKLHQRAFKEYQRFLPKDEKKQADIKLSKDKYVAYELAISSLAQGDYAQFGKHASRWNHMNDMEPDPEPNYFKGLINLAKSLCVELGMEEEDARE